MILSEETTITMMVIEEEVEVVEKVILEVDMLEVEATITNNLSEKENKGKKKIPWCCLRCN